MPSLNGDLASVRGMRARGLDPRYATAWAGAWMQTDDRRDAPAFDWSGIRRHFDACVREGVTPVVFSFYPGDSISAPFVRGEIAVKDYHKRGSRHPVKSRGGWWELNKGLARLARDTGTRGVVILETEFNKAGWAAYRADTPDALLNAPRTDTAAQRKLVGYKVRLESVLSDPAAADELLAGMAGAVRSISGGRLEVALSLGSWGGPWGDVGETLRHFPRTLRAVDVVGTQKLASLPRSGAGGYDRAAADLLGALRALDRVAPRHRKWVTDLGFSTYGGAFSARHPFAGGGPVAEARRQKRQLEALRAALAGGAGVPRVEAVFHRALTDNAAFDVANHHGHAERAWGVVTASGVKKPGYDALMALGREASRPARLKARLGMFRDALERRAPWRMLRSGSIR